MDPFWQESNRQIPAFTLIVAIRSRAIKTTQFCVRTWVSKGAHRRLKPVETDSRKGSGGLRRKEGIRVHLLGESPELDRTAVEAVVSVTAGQLIKLAMKGVNDGANRQLSVLVHLHYRELSVEFSCNSLMTGYLTDNGIRDW